MPKMNPKDEKMNVYHINIFQRLRFVHKHNLNKNPKIFVNSFNKIGQKNPTKNSLEIIINSQN